MDNLDGKITCTVDDRIVSCKTWSDGSREDLLDLLRNDAYQKGEYKLSSGRTSEHYVNCKPVTLSGKGMLLLGYALYQLVESDSAAVAGLTLGADPLVTMVAAFSGVRDKEFGTDRNLNALIVRKEAKGHGTQAWIEGPLPPLGSRITVLEDVITTGGSAIKAVEKLRNPGYRVDRIVSIVDRQVDGEADRNMLAAHVDLYSLFTLDNLI